MTISTFDAIVHRHHPDPAELNRVCRCGHPWPCDVRVLVDAVRRPTTSRNARAERAARATKFGASG
jgi:hypothetical protein